MCISAVRGPPESSFAAASVLLAQLNPFKPLQYLLQLRQHGRVGFPVLAHLLLGMKRPPNAYRANTHIALD